MEGYQPQTIVDQAIPLLSGDMSAAFGSSSGGYGADTPESIPNVKIPGANISSDVISETLNTKTGSIKGTYKFEQMGALDIESTSNPLAGVLISPTGILGTNSVGATTFALDAETGDATFSGTITASTIIGGSITGVTITGGTLAGGSIDIGGSDNTSFHVDSGGNLWIGGATFSTASWRVSSSGAMDASGIATFSGNRIAFAGNSAQMYSPTNDTISILANFSFSGASISLNGNDVNDLNLLDFDERNSAPSNSNAIYFWKSGGSYGFRSRMQSGNWQFDQTAV